MWRSWDEICAHIANVNMYLWFREEERKCLLNARSMDQSKKAMTYASSALSASGETNETDQYE